MLHIIKWQKNLCRTETCRCNCWTSYSKTEFHKISNSRTELRCGRFYSDILGSGDSFSYTFDEPGTYSYFCSPHLWMTGFVIVDDQMQIYKVMMKRTLQMIKRSKIKMMKMEMMNETYAQAYIVWRCYADAKLSNESVMSKKAMVL